MASGGEKRGLLIFGKLQLFRGPFEAQPGERKTQRVIGDLKYPRGLGIGFGEALAHSGILGALARKKKCGF